MQGSSFWTMLWIAVAWLAGQLVQGSVERIGYGEKLKHIKITCTKSHAVISYHGDPKAVLGFGLNKLCYFDSVPQEAKFRLVASFEASGPKDCQMMKRTTGDIYHLKIQARFSSPDMESDGDETAMVSCNFETQLTSQAKTIQLLDPILKPIVVEDNNGRKAKSRFSLAIHHVDGSVLPEESTVGTNAELIAMMKPTPEELAFQVILCHAEMPEEDLSIPIIIDGCGTGEIFPKDKGFVRYELFAKSPSFGLFRAVKTRAVRFRCEFLVCPTECDRFSCPLEREAEQKPRRRRSVEEKSTRSWAKTKTHQIFLRGEAKKKTFTFNDLVMNGTNNSTDPASNLARLVHEPVELTESGESLSLPIKFLVVTIVAGLLALLLVVLGVWLGWRYATRSIDMPMTSRSGSRDISITPEISEPILIHPSGAALHARATSSTGATSSTRATPSTKATLSGGVPPPARVPRSVGVPLPGGSAHPSEGGVWPFYDLSL